MATLFVSSVDGNNADSGADWANAKQTIAGALAIAASNDVIKVDSAHNFTATAAITWTPPAGNVAIISVNRAGGDAWAAGAIEAVGAASGAVTIAGAAGSSMFVFGVTGKGGTSGNTGGGVTILADVTGVSVLETEECIFEVTNVNASIQAGTFGSSSSKAKKWKSKNDSVVFSGSNSVAGAIGIGYIDVEFTKLSFSATGASKPSALFAARGLSANGGKLRVSAGDLSGYATSGGGLFLVTNWSLIEAVVENLKISATPSTVTGSWPGGPGSITLRNCDSGDTINTFEYRNAYGTLTESASIYAASGASFNGAGISWQVVTTAACNEYSPFTLPPMSVWNTLTSAQTATAEFVKDGATDLTDREIWLDISYAASASFPNYTAASDRNANPFTGAAVDQPNSSTSWTGTSGFASENKQTVDVAFTAAEVGLLKGRVSIGKASTTLYVDPKLRVA